MIFGLSFVLGRSSRKTAVEPWLAPPGGGAAVTNEEAFYGARIDGIPRPVEGETSITTRGAGSKRDQNDSRLPF